jgi:outer membrane protein OmpA-like peptidoglycan-associated protein
VEINFEAIEFPEGFMEKPFSFETFRSKVPLEPRSKAASGERIVLVPPELQPTAKAGAVKLKMAAKQLEPPAPPLLPADVEMASPPAHNIIATDDSGLAPPPLPDLLDLPPPPPLVSFERPPLSEETTKEAVADLPSPPLPVEKQAKYGDAAEPVSMPKPVLPQPQDSAAQKESKQVAALPPPSTKIPATGPLTVLFSPGSSVLNAEASKHISNIIEKMESDPSLRLQLVAYATSTDDNPSRARRLSLSRALAVRSNIVEKGVKSSRMDVLALGSKFKKAPGDRVDAVPLP